jgi:hypothetical protein
VEKYGRAGQTTEDSITRRMRFACWVNKAADTHSKYVILSRIVKVKVKFSLEQATKAQRGSRGIALLFLNPGTR